MTERSENDFWSRESDARTLLDHLTSARSALLVVLAGASHYAHLQPTPARRHFLDAVLAFTAEARR